MVHAGCLFVAGIHPYRTWMPGSLESMRWNACKLRLDLSLHTHPKEFWWNRVRTHVDSKGKILSTRKILLIEGSNPGWCITQDSEPNTLPTSYSGPQLYNNSYSPRGILLKSSFSPVLAPFCTRTLMASWARLEAAMCSAVPCSNSEQVLSMSVRETEEIGM